VIEIDGGEGCVEPTAETVASGEYSPLARPLYIYVKASSMEDPAVQEFVRFYIANAPELATDVGYFPATDAEYIDAQQKVEAAISGEGTPDSAA
jgi:phosphate transport system substrate-binding protein